MSIFPQAARDRFAANYPEVCHKLTHSLGDHPLMSLEALAQLSEWLPQASVESNAGNLPIGVSDKPEALARGTADAIRNVDTAGCWVMLKRIEQNPQYKALLESLLGELRDVIEPKTGEMLTLQGFVFISSPDAVTPFHFDPEHNILMQLRGSKVMTQFPAGDPAYAPDEAHERYHIGGPAELPWRDEMLAEGTDHRLAPGDALFVPVMAPHFVKNGPEPSISLSITWRSIWSYDEAGARCFNALLRRAGATPTAPKRWPGTNRAKCFAYRGYRRVFGPLEPQ